MFLNCRFAPILAFLALPASGSYISTVECNNTVLTGTTSQICGVDTATAWLQVTEGVINYYLSATAYATSDYTDTARASLNGSTTYSVLITAPFGQGYFSPCGAVAYDGFQGSGSASIFGLTPTARARTFYGCGQPVPFVTGVAQTLVIPLSVWAATTNFPVPGKNGSAMAAFTGIQVFDSGMTPDASATYALVNVEAASTPEPASALLFLLGLIGFGLLRRR